MSDKKNKKQKNSGSAAAKLEDAQKQDPAVQLTKEIEEAILAHQDRWRREEPTHVTITDPVGPEGQESLKKYHKNSKIEFKPVGSHPHPFGAYCRKTFDRRVMHGICAGPDWKFIDVGGHVRTVFEPDVLNNTVSEYNTTGRPILKKAFMHERTHSFCPLLDKRDEKRHFDWDQRLMSSGRSVKDWYCDCVADAKGHCEHSAKFIKNQLVGNARLCLKSIDSIYYPGVLEYLVTISRNHYLEWESTKDLSKIAPTYIAFHDLGGAYKTKQSRTCDGEASIKFITRSGYIYAKHDVTGNQEVYDHKVVNVPADSWQVCLKDILPQKTTPPPSRLDNIYIHLPEEEEEKSELLDYQGISPKKSVVQIESDENFYAHFDVVAKINQNSHNYLLVKMQVHRGKFSDHANYPTPEDFFLKENKEKAPTMIETISQSVTSALDVSATYMVDYFNRHKIKASLDPLKQTIKMQVPSTSLLRFFCCTQKFVTYEEVEAPFALVNEMLGKLGAETDLTRIGHKLNSFRAEKIQVKGQTFDPEYVENLSKASIIALTWSAEFNAKVLKDVSANTSVLKLKDVLSGINIGPKLFDIGKIFQFFIFGFILCSAIWYGAHYFREIWRFLFGAPQPLIMGGSGFLVPDYGFDQEDPGLFAPFVCMLMMTALKFVKFRHVVVQETENYEYILETSVTQIKRLQAGKKKGGYDPKLKFKNDDWNPIKGGEVIETVLQHLDTKDKKIGAWRVGPILRGKKLYTPTIKSSDKACKVAALISATDLEMTLNPEKSREFAAFIKKTMADASAIVRRNLYGYKFTWEEFYKKYEPSYVEALKKEIVEFPNREVKNGKDTAFPKKEKQISEVPHDLKDTAANEVKERMIISSQYKLSNIVMDKLTEAYKEAFEELFGFTVMFPSVSTSQVGPALYRLYAYVSGAIIMEADGSRFDKCVWWLYDYIIGQGLLEGVADCEFPYPITMEYLEEAILECHTKNGTKVSFGPNTVEGYYCGRKSGVGKTYLANTILMALVWLFVMKKVGITRGMTSLMTFTVKGDDTIAFINRLYKEKIIKVVDDYFPKQDAPGDGKVGIIFKKLLWHESIEQATFLSLSFIDSVRHWRAVRILNRVNQMTPWSTQLDKVKHRDFEEARDMLTFMMGSSMMDWARNVPIYRELGLVMMKIGKKTDLKTARKYHIINERELQAKGVNVDQCFSSNLDKNDQDYKDGWDWLKRQFGATDLEIQSAIRDINRFTSHMDVCENPIFDKMNPFVCAVAA